MFEKVMGYAVPIGMALLILFGPHHVRAEAEDVAATS
jgi:hypothetical protein